MQGTSQAGRFPFFRYCRYLFITSPKCDSWPLSYSAGIFTRHPFATHEMLTPDISWLISFIASFKAFDKLPVSFGFTGLTYKVAFQLSSAPCLISRLALLPFNNA